MNTRIAAKTLLTAFSSFEQFLAATDLAICNQASNSYRSPNSALETCEAILGKINESDVIHNLKIKIENLIENTKETDRKIIFLFYCHNLSSNQIGEMLGLGQRTVFRQIRRATEKFGLRLQSAGITPEYFDKLITEQRLIRSIYRRIVREESMTDITRGTKRGNKPHDVMQPQSM